MQSKNCQTLHWKAGHKAVCARHAAQLGRSLVGDQDEDEGEKERALNRWVGAWASAIITCLSIALDLANHQWDRHESHVYVHLSATINRLLLIRIRRKALFFMWCIPALTKTHGCLGLRSFHIPQTLALNLIRPSRLQELRSSHTQRWLDSLLSSKTM